jgi:hypothetical protein
LDELEVVTLQEIIDSRFGTFEDEIDSITLYEYDATVGLPYNIGCSYETGCGVRFEWVVTDEE